MEKLDKVIAALTCCRVNEDEPCEVGCPYSGVEGCVDKVMLDALEWLKEQNRLIEELSDHIPCCDNCEGKTVIGERTDKCVYEIEGFDSVIYCASRGIANCFGYRKKIRELEAKVNDAEPVVHARWVLMKQRPVGSRHDHYCSACGQHGARDYGRCPGCGAHMGEEVTDG